MLPNFQSSKLNLQQIISKIAQLSTISMQNISAVEEILDETRTVIPHEAPFCLCETEKNILQRPIFPQIRMFISSKVAKIT